MENLAGRDLPSVSPLPQVTFDGVLSQGIRDVFSGLGAWNYADFLLGLSIFLGIMAVLIAIVGVYFHMEQQSLRAERDEWLKSYVHAGKQTKRQAQTRWQKIRTLFASQNDADWRMAIIESDAMLEDLMLHLGYDGNTLGERLKSANKQNFPAIEMAWKAHLVRNKIAHEGSRFQLSHMQALRVMRWYEEVFRQARHLRG